MNSVAIWGNITSPRFLLFEDPNPAFFSIVCKQLDLEEQDSSRFLYHILIGNYHSPFKMPCQ